MQEILSNEAVMTGIVGVIGAMLTLIAYTLLAMRPQITRIVTALGDAGVEAIDSWNGLAKDERRRRAADDLVQAVEQERSDLSGHDKLELALERANELETVVRPEDIEAAVRRMNQWRDGVLGPHEWEPEIVGDGDGS